jgi:hypothetical protein
MRIVLTNMDKLQAVVSTTNADNIVRSMQIALYQEAQIMFANSQRIVPVDTGTLARSGILNAPRVEGATTIIDMGYGGAASAYALIQHENLSFHHAEGKSAKYLELPVYERIPNLTANLVERMARITNA